MPSLMHSKGAVSQPPVGGNLLADYKNTELQAGNVNVPIAFPPKGFISQFLAVASDVGVARPKGRPNIGFSDSTVQTGSSGEGGTGGSSSVNNQINRISSDDVPLMALTSQSYIYRATLTANGSSYDINTITSVLTSPGLNMVLALGGTDVNIEAFAFLNNTATLTTGWPVSAFLMAQVIPNTWDDISNNCYMDLGFATTTAQRHYGYTHRNQAGWHGTWWETGAISGIYLDATTQFSRHVATLTGTGINLANTDADGRPAHGLAIGGVEAHIGEFVKAGDNATQNITLPVADPAAIIFLFHQYDVADAGFYDSQGSWGCGLWAGDASQGSRINSGVIQSNTDTRGQVYTRDDAAICMGDMAGPSTPRDIGYAVVTVSGTTMTVTWNGTPGNRTPTISYLALK